MARNKIVRTWPEFPPSLDKYTPDMSELVFQGIRVWGLSKSKDGDRYVEKFRRELSP